MTPCMVLFNNREKIFTTLLWVWVSIWFPKSIMTALSEASDMLRTAFRKNLAYFGYGVCRDCPNLAIFILQSIPGWIMHNII